MASRNLQLVLEYDGTPYAGWQRQKEAPTVQGTLEEKLAQITGHPVELLVAGRTDAGVHALGQTANFHTTSSLPVKRLFEVANQLLPHSIRVVKMREVPAAFHATYHASAKLYRYIIRNSADYTVFDRDFYHHLRRPLDTGAMQKAGRLLEGTHDFTAFRGALGKWADPIRVLTRVRVRRQGDDILLEYLGKSFLHQMVRILSGTLVYVGSGKFRPEDMPAILKSKDRKKAGPTLPPNGLFLVKVFYPKTFPPVRPKKGRDEE
ncbi:MAG TPA: tRNA pseudouridine(38-40) synthase TruA [bacterium]|nr:tRNA pseudouridine(38-40) synthase TruA [bacterium]